MSSPAHDLILRGARVIDPFTSHDGVADVAVKDGVVSAVEPGLDPDGGGDAIDLHGRWLLPGMIDTHVHVAGELEGITGPGVGLRNVVEAGATTVIDLGGSMDRLVDGVQRYGAGANVGGLGMLKPGVTLSSDEPPFSELASVLDRALEAGQLGLKMWGGYYPFSPDVTAEVIRLCNERTAYVAFHVGTKETGSRLDGLREVPGLLGADGRLHIAHVNAYCRGSVASPAEEIAEALEIIDSLRGRVVSEVHLARPNFTRGECDGLGNVSMDVARNCLGLRGYPPTREGMRSAIRAGYGSVVRQKPSGLELVTGEDGVQLFEEADTVVGMSFPVNRSDTAFQLTAAKRQNGTFIIDAIASDAGVLPRNVNIEQAMAMTAFGALTPLEVARKISYNPARMLGLEKKGRIAPGADADFTVIDPAKGRAVMSFVGGEVIMIDGRAVGHGGTLLVTEAGKAAATACGLPFEVIDLSRSLLYSDA